MFDFTHQYEVTVELSDSHTFALEYAHEGKTFIEGRPNSEYAFNFTNHSFEDVYVVPSVDGKSLFSNTEASLTSEGRVCKPQASHLFTGFDIGDTGYKLSFNDLKPGSRLAHGAGVIGLLIFRPLTQMPMSAPIDLQLQAVPSNEIYSAVTMNVPDTSTNTYADTTAHPSTRRITASSMSNSLHTDLGEAYKVVDKSTDHLNFYKRDADYPDALMAMFYDNARGLERRGIKLRHKNKFDPDPFPLYNHTR